jgi:hypothetical protein
MPDDLYPILETAGAVCLGFCVVGYVMRWLAVRKVRKQFRSKGFLRVPSGFEWFRFFHARHYEMFEDSVARFLFAFSHFCMWGMIVIFSGGTVLLGYMILASALAPTP